MHKDQNHVHPIQVDLNDEQREAIAWLMKHLPLGFQPAHCAEARAMLHWSVHALAFRSKVSHRAIRSIENGAELRALRCRLSLIPLNLQDWCSFLAPPCDQIIVEALHPTQENGTTTAYLRNAAGHLTHQSWSIRVV